MDTNNEQTGEQPALDASIRNEARAIQLAAGTPSAVEFLKARDVEASVIEQVLAADLPAPEEGRQPA